MKKPEALDQDVSRQIRYQYLHQRGRTKPGRNWFNRFPFFITDEIYEVIFSPWALIPPKLSIFTAAQRKKKRVKITKEHNGMQHLTALSLPYSIIILLCCFEVKFLRKTKTHHQQRSYTTIASYCASIDSILLKWHLDEVTGESEKQKHP